MNSSMLLKQTLVAGAMLLGLTACASNVAPMLATMPPASQQTPPVPAPQAALSQGAGNATLAPRQRGCVSAAGFPNFPAEYQGALQDIACHLQTVDGLPADVVIPALQNARFDARAVAMMTPAPPSPGPHVPYPWWRYRDRFLSPDRLARGTRFWQAHTAAIDAIAEKYGVPGPILLGILNIETAFGSFQGNFSVLDSNLSLALALPGRKRFFIHQSAATLRLSQRLGVNPAVLKGSQAGAMGMSQFLASSYLRYGVTWDDPPGGPLPDLWRSVPDVLASTANFFRGHGWQPGQPVLQRAALDPNADVTPFLQGRHTLAALDRAGIRPAGDSGMSPDTRVGLLRLQGEAGPVFYVAYPNFYAIMGYNPSVYYAATVWAYAQALTRDRQVATLAAAGQ